MSKLYRRNCARLLWEELEKLESLRSFSQRLKIFTLLSKRLRYSQCNCVHLHLYNLDSEESYDPLEDSWSFFTVHISWKTYILFKIYLRENIFWKFQEVDLSFKHLLGNKFFRDETFWRLVVDTCGSERLSTRNWMKQNIMVGKSFSHMIFHLKRRHFLQKFVECKHFWKVEHKLHLQ